MFPKPTIFENKDAFFARAMSETILKKEFPIDSEREKVVLSIWENKDDFVKSMLKSKKTEFTSSFADVSKGKGDILLRVKGIASGFNNKDKDGDVLDAGSFKKTISERLKKIPLLFNHDEAATLAVALDELYTTEVGLTYVASITKGNHWRKLNVDLFDIAKKIENLEAVKHSIWFQAYKDKIETRETNGKKYAYYKEVKLMEVSILDVEPANDFTPLLSVSCEGDFCARTKSLKEKYADIVSLGNISNIDSTLNQIKGLIDSDPTYLHALLRFNPQFAIETTKPRPELDLFYH